MVERVLLYVEDEDAAFLLFRNALETANIMVDLHRAIDGEQALHFLRHSGATSNAPRPHLVVLDLNLPRKSGLAVLDEMKHNRELESIDVVIFSSSPMTSDRRQSLALGAADYITKPLTYDGLVEAVKTACSYLPEADRGGELTGRP